MSEAARDPRGPVVLAEKILSLLDQGRFTATYKYAVLLALVDLCMEHTTRTGEAPQTLTTRQLAEKTVELYWTHASPFDTPDGMAVLQQNQGPPHTQAAVLRRIMRFRNDAAPDPSLPLARARWEAPRAFERMVRQVEWKLVQMPLPRLQRFGGTEDPFLYTIHWDEEVSRGTVARYQRGEAGDFDNRIILKDGVGEHLVLLNGLLRPLIQRQWSEMVARLNGLPEFRLQDFLFGPRRISLDPIRPGLREIQADRCFYCHDRLRGRGAMGATVDHFVPWARYPNNAVENLVVAHDRCNNHKRDFLAAAEHVERWGARLSEDSRNARDLRELAESRRWESNRDRTLSVARAVYLRLPREVLLWRIHDEFVEAETRVLEEVLA